MFPGCYGTKEDDNKREAEQLAALRRRDKLFRLSTDNARLLVTLRALYCEHAAVLAISCLRVGPAYGQAAALLNELEPESETDD